METPKKLIIFSQKKAVFIYWEKKPLKKIIFQEAEVSYISAYKLLQLKRGKSLF